MAISNKRELDKIINRIRYQLKAIIRKINIKYQYIDIDDLYQEALLYLWQQNEIGKLKNKNDSYILQGCYYHLKNHIRTNIKDNYKQINSLDSTNSFYGTPDKNNKNKEENQDVFYQNFDEHLYQEEFNKRLSLREKILLDLRIKGLTIREIGKKMGISHTMVAKMRKKIIEKYKLLE